MCVCVFVCAGLSVVFCSLWPHGLYSLPGSSVHGIFQVRILEWFAISYSRGSFQPRGLTWVSCISHIGRWILYHHATSEVPSPPIVSTFFFFSSDENFKSTILATFKNILQYWWWSPCYTLYPLSDFWFCFIHSGFLSTRAWQKVFSRWNL